MSSSWVVEAIIQFIKSPLWTVPVNNFIDERCVVFFDEDAGEMKNEYHTEYVAFQEMIDSLLTTFMDELAVPAEEVLQACKDRLALEEVAGKRNAYLTELIEYITYLSDFRAFFSFMRKRNKDLSLETAEELSRLAKEKKQNSRTEPSQPAAAQPVETDDERELRLAIEASLADAQMLQSRMEAEDAELQKALALSVAAEEERLEAQRKYLAECALKADEARRLAAEQELAKLEAERADRIRRMEEATLQQRQENVRSHTDKIQTVLTQPDSEAAAAAVAPVPSKPVPLVSAAEATVAPPTLATAPSPSYDSFSQDVIHSTSSTILPAPEQKSLPDVGRRGGGFGFKALPSIQPSLKELTAQVQAEPTPVAVSKPATSVAPAQVQINRTVPTPEEAEARAREMRELRARMIEAKKATRNAELENYKKHGTEGSGSSTATAAVDPNKQVTVELARRLRADLLLETKKNQNSS